MKRSEIFFNEIYGTYFNVVSSILQQAQTGELTVEKLNRIVQEQAFGDSYLTIPKSLRDCAWPLLQMI